MKTGLYLVFALWAAGIFASGNPHDCSALEAFIRAKYPGAAKLAESSHAAIFIAGTPTNHPDIQSPKMVTKAVGDPFLRKRQERAALLSHRLHEMDPDHFVPYFAIPNDELGITEMITPYHPHLRGLRSELNRDSANVMKHSWEITDALLGTLKTLKARHLNHWDIKPGNILVGINSDTNKMEVKLIDLESVTAFGEPQSVFYTPGFAPLELVKGSPRSQGEADLYAMRMTLWSVLVGKGVQDPKVLGITYEEVLPTKELDDQGRPKYKHFANIPRVAPDVDSRVPKALAVAVWTPLHLVKNLEEYDSVIRKAHDLPLEEFIFYYSETYLRGPDAPEIILASNTLIEAFRHNALGLSDEEMNSIEAQFREWQATRVSLDQLSSRVVAFERHPFNHYGRLERALTPLSRSSLYRRAVGFFRWR
ncbi:MAG: hypothetical protein HYR96_10635 [Deltaproteobacteria bacterium]|nr:hypothetical protein [Deltaproteobacteria bacterium]MBI3294898.1 hypothetical protein [Deltaproteobacteria bacterium]